MKAGSKVYVKFINVDGSEGREPATVAITTREMLPMPAGYVPVRFHDGGATALIPSDRIAPRAA